MSESRKLSDLRTLKDFEYFDLTEGNIDSDNCAASWKCGLRTGDY